MRNDDLKSYKNKISSLSMNEKKLRDIYLRNFALGNIQGPHTGYPSIDKPWLKFYDQSELEENIRTVYEELYEDNKEHLDDLALEFFGKKVTYRELFSKIDRVSKEFLNLGLKQGDYITICSAGIPEMVYSFYASAKIGTVSTMISPFFDKDDLVQRIEDCKSDVLIIMDSFYKEMKEYIDKSRIKKVIIVPTLNSSFIGKIQRKPKITNPNKEILWNDFMKTDVDHVKDVTVRYSDNMPLAMVFSSGTTGASKGILLSHSSFQNSLMGYSISGVEMVRGTKFYQIIPPWFSTGLSTSMHLPLVHGACVFMDPRFERKIFIKNILKAKPNYCVAPTSMYEAFIDNKKLKNKDLSYFKYPFEGGEPLIKEVSDRIENVFKDHHSDASLLVGYGQCECGATITTETAFTPHKDGNVGIPLPGINISILDEDKNEIGYNRRGQICVDTPCSMIGYYKNEKGTNDYFYVDDSGVKWNCTGDIGYIDESGSLFIEGRSSDYTLLNGNQKIYNFDIENIVKRIPGIKMVDVLDKNGNVSNQLIVHLILENNVLDDISKGFDSYDNIINRIQTEIYNKYNDVNIVPKIFKFRDSFPYAKSGKRNTIEMKNETNEFIYEKFSLENKKIK